MWVVVFATTTSCASTWKPLDVNALERAKAKTLLLVYRRSDSFLGPNTNPLVGGMLGVVRMVNEGQKIQTENHIVDPIQDLGSAIAVPFARKQGLFLETYAELPIPIQTQPHRQIAPPPLPGRPSRDLYLEVQTEAWSVTAPLFGYAAVHYNASARLVEEKTHKVLAEGHCGNTDEATQEAAKRSYDDVLANHAAFVKAVLTQTASHCVEVFQTSLLLAPDLKPQTVSSPVSPARDGGSPDQPKDD